MKYYVLSYFSTKFFISSCESFPLYLIQANFTCRETNLTGPAQFLATNVWLGDH